MKHLVPALTALFLFAAACETKQKLKNNRLTIVTTTGMIKDAVEQVTAGNAEVIALMGPGVDPHLYKATQGDLDKLTSADIIFYNGLHLEGKMGEVLEKLSRVKPVIAVTAELPDSLLREVPGFEGIRDPHVWFDVQLWKRAVHSISNAMQQYDSLGKEAYQLAATRYAQKLDSLHQSVTQRIQDVPDGQRVLITAHDAFGYFGAAYGIDVRGLQGISTQSEFGLRDVTELVDFIISRKIKAIFVETSVSEKSIAAVMEGCRQKGWNVSIGGSLYSDAMGTEGTPEGTYLGMVHKNVDTIVNALK
jgi:manganese/zinc/iron transport system substrate-binding protein